MAFALALLIPFATEEKKERVLELFDAISRETFAKEHENIAYCWFRKSLDSSLQGPMVCGVEIYEREQSLTGTHRAGEAYQNMRALALEEKLFLRPSPLVFLEPILPVELCFLTRGDADVHFSDEKEKGTYSIISQYFPATSDIRTTLEKKLEELAVAAVGDDSVLTFYPLQRRRAEAEDSQDQGTITVFERYRSHTEYGGRSARVRELTNEARRVAGKFEVSTWTNGVGHIRGGRIIKT